jgi:hypothetical protein
MRKLIMAAMLAGGIAVAPLGALPAQASSAPSVTCTAYELENGLALFLYNDSGIVKMHDSGNPTEYCEQAAGTTGYTWLVQNGTNLCLTYNATHNYIDEITCSTSVVSSQWEEFVVATGKAEWYNVYGDDCLSGATLNNDAKTNTCSTSSEADLWHF